MHQCEYYCNHRHLSLVVKTQSETYIQQVLTCPAGKSWQIPQLLHLWNDALIFILVFSLAQSSSLFWHCFSPSVFLFLLFDVNNGGTCLSSVVVVCSPPLLTVWAWTYLTRWEQTLHLCEGGDTSQTRPLALIGCVEEGAVDFSKSNYSHWVELQTADLYLILLSDHNDNFSKYNKTIVTDYNFKIF